MTEGTQRTCIVRQQQDQIHRRQQQDKVHPRQQQEQRQSRQQKEQNQQQKNQGRGRLRGVAGAARRPRVGPSAAAIGANLPDLKKLPNTKFECDESKG